MRQIILSVVTNSYDGNNIDMKLRVCVANYSETRRQIGTDYVYKSISTPTLQGNDEAGKDNWTSLLPSCVFDIHIL